MYDSNYNIEDNSSLLSSKPFEHVERAPSNLCTYCRKNINSSCSVHLSGCEYSCNPNPVLISDGIVLMMIFSLIYLAKKYI